MIDDELVNSYSDIDDLDTDDISLHSHSSPIHHPTHSPTHAHRTTVHSNDLSCDTTGFGTKIMYAPYPPTPQTAYHPQYQYHPPGPGQHRPNMVDYVSRREVDDAIEKSAGAFEKSIGLIREEIKYLRNELQRRLERLETRVDKLAERLPSVEDALKELSSRRHRQHDKHPRSHTGSDSEHHAKRRKLSVLKKKDLSDKVHDCLKKLGLCMYHFRNDCRAGPNCKYKHGMSDNIVDELLGTDIVLSKKYKGKHTPAYDYVRQHNHSKGQQRIKQETKQRAIDDFGQPIRRENESNASSEEEDD